MNPFRVIMFVIGMICMVLGMLPPWTPLLTTILNIAMIAVGVWYVYLALTKSI